MKRMKEVYRLIKSDLAMIEAAKQDFTKFHAAHLGVVLATRKVWNYTAEGLIAKQCPNHPEGTCYVLVKRGTEVNVARLVREVSAQLSSAATITYDWARSIMELPGFAEISHDRNSIRTWIIDRLDIPAEGVDEVVDIIMKGL